MKEKKQNKIFIKNMVCDRCIMTVETILDNQGIPHGRVLLGEAELAAELGEPKLQELSNALRRVGFELIETRVKKIIEDIKKHVRSYIGELSVDKRLKLSSYITSRLHYDYSYVSDLFSSVEGITIEQFFIVQRIEKVKELMVYEELSLTEISYQTGFSSVHHLSAQFKKVTGLTPSHFKKIGAEKRKSIDRP